MEPAKVYKIKIRENILRQVVFTDKNLFIALIVFIISSIWKCFESMPTDIKVLLSLSLSGLSLLLISIKIDRQSIIKILIRTFSYSKRIKKNRF